MAKMTASDEELALASKAREYFEQYATFGGDPDETSFTRTPVRALQIKLARWQNNMPWESNWMTTALGMCEEGCWELTEAYERGDQEEAFDALADVLIFGCNAATLVRADFLTVVDDFLPLEDQQFEMFRGDSIVAWNRLFQGIGQFAHVALKEFQRIRGYDDINYARSMGIVALRRIFTAVRWHAFAADMDAGVLFEKVANKVLLRNFNRDRVNGGQ